MNHKQTKKQSKLPTTLKAKKTTHITRERERELIKDFQENNSVAALESLLEAHNPYVQHLAAKSYKQFNKAVEFEDLVQQARIGFIRAAQDFDLDKTVEDPESPNFGQTLRFLTYAHRKIMAQMQEAWHHAHPVHIPAHTLRDVQFEKKEVLASGELVAIPTNPKNDALKKLARLAMKAESLDNIIDDSRDGRSSGLYELQFSVNHNVQDPTFEEGTKRIYAPIIEEAIDKLTPLEWKVFEMKAGLWLHGPGHKYSTREIATELQMEAYEVDKLFKRAKRILGRHIAPAYNEDIEIECR